MCGLNVCVSCGVSPRSGRNSCLCVITLAQPGVLLFTEGSYVSLARPLWPSSSSAKDRLIGDWIWGCVACDQIQGTSRINDTANPLFSCVTVSVPCLDGLSPRSLCRRRARPLSDAWAGFAHESLNSWCVWWESFLWVVPGSPVAKTLRSQCRWAGLHPWSGNWITHSRTLQRRSKIVHAATKTRHSQVNKKEKKLKRNNRIKFKRKEYPL